MEPVDTAFLRVLGWSNVQAWKKICVLSFTVVDTAPNTHSVKEEFNVAHVLRGLSPWSTAPRQEHHGGWV